MRRANQQHWSPSKGVAKKQDASMIDQSYQKQLSQQKELQQEDPTFGEVNQDSSLSPEKKTNNLQRSIIDPGSLKILILCGTQIPSHELGCITSCINLLKLDISSNGIVNLPTTLSFSNLPQLQILYMHNNFIEEITSLFSLFEAQSLRYLTLFNNPISSKWSLRHFLVTSITSLYAFDFNAVTDEERMPTMGKTKRFSAFSDETRINWPLVRVPSHSLSGDEQYLQVFKHEVKLVRQIYQGISPCTIIQKNCRGFLVRNALRRVREKSLEESELYPSVIQEEQRQSNRQKTLVEVLTSRGKQHLLLDKKKYDRKQRMRDIVTEYVNAFRTKKIRALAARVILKALKVWHAFVQSVFPVFFQNTKKYQIYILNDQKSQLNEIIKKAGWRMSKMKNILKDSSFVTTAKQDSNDGSLNVRIEAIKPVDRIACIRLHEDQTHIFRSRIPLLSVMRPSLLAKVIISDAKVVGASSVFLQRFRKAVTVPSLEKKGEPFDPVSRNKFRLVREKLMHFWKNKYSLITSCTFVDRKSAKAFMTQYVLSHLKQCLYLDYSNKQAHESQLVGGTDVGERFHSMMVDEYANTEETQRGGHQGISSGSFDRGDAMIGVRSFQENLESMFVIFSARELTRVSSAIKIQKWFRLYLSKSSLVPVMESIQIMRACLKIQHWIRNIRWSHSISLRRVLQGYMCSIISSTVYIPFEVYFNLRRICAATQLEYSLFQLLESRGIEVSFCHEQLYVSYKQNVGQSLMIAALVQMGKRQAEGAKYSQQVGDAMHIMHVGSKPGICVSIGGIKYLRLTFADVNEAKRRAAILVLFTYRFQLNGSFVRLYNAQQICSKSFMLEEISKTSIVYSLQLDWKDDEHILQSEKAIGSESSVFITSQERFQQLKIVTNPEIAPAAPVELYTEQQIESSNGATGFVSPSSIRIVKVITELTVIRSEGLILSMPNESNVVQKKKIIVRPLNLDQRQQQAKKIIPWAEQEKNGSFLYDQTMSGSVSIMSGTNYKTRRLRKQSQSNGLIQVSGSQVRNSTDMSMMSAGSVFNQNSLEVLKILKDRETKIIDEKAKLVEEQRKRHRLATEMNAVEMSVSKTERKNQIIREKRSLTFQQTQILLNDITKNCDKIASVKRVRAESQESKDFTASFHRGSNSLIKQIHSFNTRQVIGKIEEQSAAKVKVLKSKSNSVSRGMLMKSVGVSGNSGYELPNQAKLSGQSVPLIQKPVVIIPNSQRTPIVVERRGNQASLSTRKGMLLQAGTTNRSVMQQPERFHTDMEGYTRSKQSESDSLSQIQFYTMRKNDEDDCQYAETSNVHENSELYGEKQSIQLPSFSAGSANIGIGTAQSSVNASKSATKSKWKPSYAVFAEELFPLMKKGGHQVHF